MNFRRLAVVGAAIVVIIVVVSIERTNRGPTVRVGNAVFTVEIADEPAEQAQGLSGRPSLAADYGMLFIFPTADRYSFWMRNMQFSLDIVWIADGKVVDISRNLPPEGDAPALMYQPQVPAEMVLEINAGTADAKGIKVGDEVSTEENYSNF